MPWFWDAEGSQDFLLGCWTWGGKVSMAPLIAMVAERSGRNCLITLAMLLVWSSTPRLHAMPAGADRGPRRVRPGVQDR